MAVAERLALIARIWDSLDPEDIPLADAQRNELDRRVDEMERDGGAGIPWDEAQTRIRSRLG